MTDSSTHAPQGLVSPSFSTLHTPSPGLDPQATPDAPVEVGAPAAAAGPAPARLGAAADLHASLQSAPIGHILLEAPASRRPAEYLAVLVQPGWIRNADGTDSDWYIPTAVLQDAADRRLFTGISHYLDHPPQFGFGWRQNPSIRDLGGVIADASWDPELEAVTATIRLYDTDTGQLMRTLYDQILADQLAGRPIPPIGLSIAAYRTFTADDDSGARTWTRITKVDSVDLVYEPGAAGYVRQALSSVTPALSSPTILTTGDPPMEDTPTYHTEPAPGPADAVLTTDNCPPPTAVPAVDTDNCPLETAVPAVDTDNCPLTTDDRLTRIQDNVNTLHQIVGRLATAVEHQAEDATIRGLGDPPRDQARLYAGRDSLDRVHLAAEALISGTRPPDGIASLTGIRELYMILSGDHDLTGRFDPDRVYLANVNTSTMSNIVADVLNKRVINMFQSYDQWWLPAVTVQDFATLQDIKWITIGGVAELPTVAEGAAYTEMTWDDQRETSSFVKKGGYLGITLETIDKDDTGRVMAIPRALAQAAWMTLGKSIASIFTAQSGTGPDMSDSNALFHNNHNNLGSTALSYAAWKATKTAMMKQTELNSSERLGALTRPRLLWVPIDLEEAALEIMAAGEGQIGSADYHVNPQALAEGVMARNARARQRVITCPFWTDTTNWAAQANPSLYPSIGLGFRYGRTPEIFSVADPRAGLMFTNDTMPVKVRFFYAVGPTDWRGLYKHNV